MEMRPRKKEKRRDRIRNVHPALMPTAIIIICIWMLVAVAFSGYPIFSF
jgi:hypothetical protein